MNSHHRISSMDLKRDNAILKADCTLSNVMVMEGEDFQTDLDDNFVYNLMKEFDVETESSCQDGKVVAEKLYDDNGSDIHGVEGLTPLTPVDYNYGTSPVTKMAADDIESHFSMASTPLLTTDEVIESVLDIPFTSADDSEDVVTVVVTSAEDEEPPRRKRGRRPKSETGPYVPPPRRRKPRKRKVYEIDEPFEDEEKEKKRQNAINAKKHRDEQKTEKQTLMQQLEEVKKERDSLKKEVEMLREREVESKKQLEHFKKQARIFLSGLEKNPLSL